ncbi:hypothetical protein ZYGR_0Z00650 [Zygosaccharomyces rouxii]|uniref:ZYRO0G01694p n=2 Tax=Zygosaccharomyces rouxii TaxID=4956 RepID=C5E1V1_ZYGRC|nr:uncharacterized protein ZYRO0G01694g [Zygosaccharomyces rouxii]GAV50642.1 hypothetical protein ZYGR_0Z00650 [Zygosaccharomyces rouxii]CAR29144.1 ZYRO0G01694p [Zygosaccharomyces rouxii]
MGFDLGQYLLDQWRKRYEFVEEPSESERLILSSGFQEMLRKLLVEAQSNAHRDGFNEVRPAHLEAALDELLDA